MEQSSQSPRPVIRVATGASQLAYAVPPYPPAMVTGAPAVIGSIPPAAEAYASFPANPAQLTNQQQIAYQQVQQFHQQQQQHQNQQLRAFWANQMTEIEQTNDFKNQSLPLARIKKIMKADEDVRMISAEAPVVFAKACEMFILELTLRAWIHTEENKRRTLQKNDIAAAITRTDIFDFLVDIVPRDELKEEGDGLGLPRAALQATMGGEAVPYPYVPMPGMIPATMYGQQPLYLWGQHPPGQPQQQPQQTSDSGQEEQ